MKTKRTLPVPQRRSQDGLAELDQLLAFALRKEAAMEKSCKPGVGDITENFVARQKHRRGSAVKPSMRKPI